MSRYNTKKYSGILLQRLPVLSRGIIRNENQIKLEIGRRFVALLEHYEIKARGPSIDWCELATQLALDHVEGFQTKGRRGRPSKEIEKREPRKALLELCETHPKLIYANEKDASEWLMRHPKELPAYYRNKSLSDDTIRAEIRAAKKQRAQEAELNDAISRLSRETTSDLDDSSV
jgi:hypothetical protein